MPREQHECGEFGKLHERLAQIEIDIADATEHLDDLGRMIEAVNRGDDLREIVVRLIKMGCEDVTDVIAAIKQDRDDIIEHFRAHHGYAPPRG